MVTDDYAFDGWLTDDYAFACNLSAAWNTFSSFLGGVFLFILQNCAHTPFKRPNSQNKSLLLFLSLWSYLYDNISGWTLPLPVEAEILKDIELCYLFLSLSSLSILTV